MPFSALAVGAPEALASVGEGVKAELGVALLLLLVRGEALPERLLLLHALRDREPEPERVEEGEGEARELAEGDSEAEGEPLSEGAVEEESVPEALGEAEEQKLLLAESEVVEEEEGVGVGVPEGVGVGVEECVLEAVTLVLALRLVVAEPEALTKADLLVLGEAAGEGE